MGGRPWLGWILLGLSAGLILVAIAEWNHDRGKRSSWMLPGAVVAVRGILTLRSSGDTDDP
ncbi:MAG TPA: hypothetical protein VFI35_11595 [Actinomycetota bacterium]|nr:hypothetical protein [Actinomycetota bacterium]